MKSFSRGTSRVHVIVNEHLVRASGPGTKLNLATNSRANVEIGSTLYKTCWCMIWCLHACCAIYLVKLAQLYWYLDRPYNTYFANLIEPASERHFKEAGVVFGIVGAAHLWCGLELVILSLWTKQLALSPASLPSGAAASASLKKMRSIRRRLSGSKDIVAFFRFAGITVVLKKWWSSCFGRRGFFGLESVFFDILFLVRECLEIVLQSYQAKQTSEMITTVWLNRFFVILVVINCWTTPLVQRSFRWYPALGRLAGITIDLGLTMGTNMVIPIIIFLPYLEAWHPERYSFDAELLYDDIWFSNLVMENRLLFTRSLFDFLAKIVPHVSILMSLSCIKTLLVRTGTDEHHLVPLPDGHATQAIAPLTAQVPSSTTKFSARFRLNGWKTVVTHTLLVAWGCVLLGLHISASVSSDHDQLGGCKQSIRVWFATKNTCTTFEYNCYRRHDIGLVDALKNIEPSTLLSIIVSHCKDLVVPSEIRNFPNLLSFELFNVTLLEWPASAAISPTIHSSLVVLMIACSNMTALPEGIRGPLPQSLSDIEISNTNLSTLPDDLHESWHALDVLYFEYSRVVTFPKTLTQLAVYDLSLIGNQLETVDEVAEISVEMYTLALSSNPLQQLPPAVHDNAVFGYLCVEDTLLMALPGWVNDSLVVSETAFAMGSPVCTGKYTTSSDSSSLWPLDSAAWPRVDCSSGDPRVGGRYPLAVMLPRRVP